MKPTRDALGAITEKLMDEGSQATARELATFAVVSERMIQKELKKLTGEGWVVKHGKKYQFSKKARREQTGVTQELDENQDFEKVVEGLVGVFCRNRKPPHRPPKSSSQRTTSADQGSGAQRTTYSPANPQGATNDGTERPANPKTGHDYLLKNNNKQTTNNETNEIHGEDQKGSTGYQDLLNASRDKKELHHAQDRCSNAGLAGKQMPRATLKRKAVTEKKPRKTASQVSTDLKCEMVREDCHPDYLYMGDTERDCEYARRYGEALAKGPNGKTSYCDILCNPDLLVQHKGMLGRMHRGRVHADSIQARYHELVDALFADYRKRHEQDPENCKAIPYENSLGGPYVTTVYESRVRSAGSYIINFENLPEWLHPKNYEGTPDQVRWYKATVEAIREFCQFRHSNIVSEMQFQLKETQNIPFQFFRDYGRELLESKDFNAVMHRPKGETEAERIVRINAGHAEKAERNRPWTEEEKRAKFGL
jgi:hypothetical protein